MMSQVVTAAMALAMLPPLPTVPNLSGATWQAIGTTRNLTPWSDFC